MVEEPGLAVSVTPHLDVVDGVAQDAGGAEDEAQTQVTYNKDNGCQLGHCGLSIECTKPQSGGIYIAARGKIALNYDLERTLQTLNLF